MMSSSFSGYSAQRSARLSVAIISPDRKRRIAATSSLAHCAYVQTRELDAYPGDASEAALLLGRGFDAILIDLDGNEALALKTVETLCVARATIVMVFSARRDPDLMLRGMHAGAREFLTLPFAPEAIEKVLAWVATHRPDAGAAKTADGRLHVFFGSKGGMGVTTVACNFAVALAEASNKSTLLIDLNLYLGDAALNLGMEPVYSPYSVSYALERAADLDADQLFKMLSQHASGLSVLGAPIDRARTSSGTAAIARLLAVARREFDYIVVDAGSKADLQQMHLFEESATAYLVTQIGIPELRNANRIIGQFSREQSPQLEIVINRHQSRFLGLTDEHLSKALTRAPRWKIPNDFKAVREMQSNGTAIVNQSSSIAPVIREMAFAICGKRAPVARAAADPSREAQKSATGRGGFRLPWKREAKAAPAATGSGRIDASAVTTVASLTAHAADGPDQLTETVGAACAPAVKRRVPRAYHPISFEFGARNKSAA